MKRDTGLFDATMSTFDGTEICELMGTFLSYKFSQK